ncbi:diguanylate cyclase/phosphodiesterase (GGDEF & EAL domains) with PAS/PAC sensor(s) [Paramagnetospirillum magnetotacticum MS-1]|uniref:Diguanylate cyclase/phosphodiesterase (GGDEF & EAL domains) with PAS/PAC sensor(S) n=1 Tax=Paramagnetospirillum magnetotacticum MS-1 TaxID=272627 RepID=A0A0C2UFU1_PARME|nr:EAL domain-containing protein [Paramagnetospirillum magnetotacticum]KIM00388.1 diguanylate cyclase/phosphodiesterase (GGDEF & EAL domains) with PAS/PAC sensor(s) [Paramagnetospirillum magnetotacticum MS-1]
MSQATEVPESRIPAGLHVALLRDLPDVLYSIDADGCFIWVSPNAEAVFGYSPLELIGTPAARMYSRPELRAETATRIREARGRAVRAEMEMRRKDGVSIWTAIYACAHFDAEGGFAGINGAIRDITEVWQTRKTLEDSEDRFRRLSDVATEAICIHFEGKIIDMNKAFETLFAYPRDELLTMWAWDVIDPRDIGLAKSMVAQQYEAPYEVRGIRKDGSVFPMEIYSKHSWMGEKSVRVTSIRDLTQSKKAEDSVRLLSQAVEQSPVAVAVVGGDAVVQYVNSAHAAITGYPQAQVVGKPLSGLYPGKARSTLDDLWRSLLTLGEWQGEVHVRRQDGAGQWQRVHGSKVATPGGGGTHYLLQIEDVTLRKDQERRLQHQAMFDGLTDLPNRVQALDRLSREIDLARERERKVALLFVDLDEFKAINDSLGHEYGDELLVLASERLRKAAGDGGTVARFGGDEFLVILGDLEDGATPQRVAAGIVERFSRPFAISRRDLIATASIGLAIYPDDGHTPQTLLRNADIAMYQAKLAGRNRFCFFTSRMNEEAEARLRMEGELRRAVGTDQFHLAYQPLVDVKSGRAVGVEALLRWSNPELGNVPPDRFIPQAETCGVIVAIGRMVLETACRDARRWVDAGHADLRLCINVSPRQFQDAGFLGHVRAALAASGLSPANLELEITEGLLLTERGDVDVLLRALTDMGIQLSIDDFGTGYSSLSYLERFPFDTLKIDRSFMIGMLERQERKVLVETIVAMASGLGLKVIAEGVETVEQLAHLTAINCDIAQGYLFSRPVPATEIPPLLERVYR